MEKLGTAPIPHLAIQNAVSVLLKEDSLFSVEVDNPYGIVTDALSGGGNRGVEDMVSHMLNIRNRALLRDDQALWVKDDAVINPIFG